MISLGVDIGFSKEVASTGICVISPGHQQPVRLAHVRTGQTLKAVRQLLQGERPTCISIDGPLVPHPKRLSRIYQVINRYRDCERNLSGGIFQKRCKPGPTNSPRGQALHRQATMVANALRVDHPAARIGEAFPNAFLGVMMPPAVFQRPIRRGIKSDVFWKFGVRNMILERLIKSLYGNHAERLVGRWHKIDNHDERAAFVCALTARAHELGSAVVIPGNLDGEILLPPSAFIQDWALNELVLRIPSLKR